MALKIADACVNCWACVDVCPSDAIYSAEKHFEINAQKCTECSGVYADPQCASICPIESAILDANNQAINPPGSLTGIPPEKVQDSMREIQAR